MADTRRQAEFRERLAAARLRLARTVAATDEERRHEMDEIDAAQARLEAGRFGVCERCQQAIPLARLRAMPAARHCATCQPHHEAAR